MSAAILLVFILSHFMMRWPTEAQERIGCFSFIFGKTVLSAKTNDTWSIEDCIQQCKTRNATYAGIRYSRHCYCGDNHDHTVNGEQLSDNSCTTSCDDHTLRCAGTTSIVIYSVCNPGGYRDNTNDKPNCDSSCNCKDNHVCLYSNGSCPDNCEPEWSGEACNVQVPQPTTEAATRTPETDNGVTVTSGASGSTDNVAGTATSRRVDPDDKGGLSVTAVAVGVSLAVLVLVVIIAIIVFIRRPHKSGDENDEGMTTPEVKTDDSTKKQMENGPTIDTATESPEPCYSSVDYLNNGRANNDGEDIPKSVDVAINGELEVVEYAVVKKPGDEMHLNLKENSLYGTNAGDSDEEGQE